MTRVFAGYFRSWTLPDAVNRVGLDPADPVGTLPGRVQPTLSGTARPCLPLKGQVAGIANSAGFRQGDKVEDLGSTQHPKCAVQDSTAGSSWYDVTAIDPVFGVGKRLERIKASSREAAEKTAHDRHGKNILVSLSGGRPRRRRELARDLGDTNNPKRSR